MAIYLAVNVPNRTDLFALNAIPDRPEHESECQRNRPFHSSILGWFSACTSESLGNSFKGHMPRPFHEPLNQYIGFRTPAHFLIVIPASAQEQEVPFNCTLDVGREPLQAPLPFSLEVD